MKGQRTRFPTKVLYWTLKVTVLLVDDCVVAFFRAPELMLALAVTAYAPTCDFWFSLKFQMATPLELVVADCVKVLPFGATAVNTTPALDAASPPFVTVAVIGTVPGRAKLDPGTATIADRTGDATTVALAVSVVFAA